MRSRSDSICLILKQKYRILDEDILETGIGVAFAKNDKRGIEKELSKTLKAMVKDGSAKNSTKICS